MDLTAYKERMQKALQTITADFATIRTGRATSTMVQDIIINAYGGAQRLRIMELASITVPDSQLIVIDPWDKSVIGEIKQGILAANVGLNPSIDSEVIRISVPPMTTEDRQKYVKLLHAKIENGRVTVRQIRGDAMQDIKKAFEAKEITEDEKFGNEKKIQEFTDQFIGEIEKAGAAKEEELLKI